MCDEGLVGAERDPEVLAAPPGRTEPLPGQPSGQVRGAGKVTTYGSGVEHLDPFDHAPGRCRDQTASDDLDLRELWHLLRRRICG
jgi:hypothetical protein